MTVSSQNRGGLLTVGGERALGWREKFDRFPWSLLALLVVSSCVGFVVLYSAVGGAENVHLIWRQLAKFCVGVILLLSIAFLGDSKIYRRYAYILYGLVLTMLVGVFMVGTVGMGARRWLTLGAIQLQPSELMKVALVLALARFFHDRSVSLVLSLQDLFIPLILIAVPTGLIVKQPDLGTAILLVGVGLMVVIVAGLSWKTLLAVVVGFGASLPLLWNVLHDYQQRRIITLFFPERDPLGSGYHIIQSKIAVGSGGMVGKGFMAGSQSYLDFLPERHTDFIFSVLAEEWGFLGGMFVILLYMMIIARAFFIATTANDRFGLLTVVGLASLFSFQVVVNIGMVVGLLPVVGIPLPLVSYGGSSMMTLLAAMGILAHVSIHSKQHGCSM